MNTYQDFPTQLIPEISKNKKLARDISMAHVCTDKNGNFLFYCGLHYPARFKVSEDLKEAAKKQHEANRLEAITQVKNKLLFVGMGMDYPKENEQDPGNYRIITYIKNPKGRRFFIELSRINGGYINFDFVIDSDEQTKYEELRKINFDKIQKYGEFIKLPHEHPLRLEHSRLQSQPYYQYKSQEYRGRKYKYERNTIIEVVNNLFQCNFNTMEVDSILLNTEDYTSTSPQF
jgi:hypothetical protein